MRMADIPPAVLRRLNKGEIESVTLAETLAVDFHLLLKSAFPDLDKSLLGEMHHAKKELGWVERTRLAGVALHKSLGKKGLRQTLGHTSDQVRGWGASLIAAIPDMDIEERLSLVRPIADDANPGVRETAWIMLRPHIAEDIRHSIKILKPWVREDSANIRRYASEITRPRGVWCSHIPELRENPKLGLPLLAPLRADDSRYVQNSVANWLNDASKDDPQWVTALCRKWGRKTARPQTVYICRRALRTIRKNES